MPINWIDSNQLQCDVSNNDHIKCFIFNYQCDGFIIHINYLSGRLLLDERVIEGILQSSRPMQSLFGHQLRDFKPVKRDIYYVISSFQTKMNIFFFLNRNWCANVWPNDRAGSRWERMHGMSIRIGNWVWINKRQCSLCVWIFTWLKTVWSANSKQITQIRKQSKHRSHIKSDSDFDEMNKPQ